VWFRLVSASFPRGHDFHMELTAAGGALTSQVLCPRTLLCSLKIKDGSHGNISLSETKVIDKGHSSL